MTAPMNCQLVGRWRIVEADLWDRDHLDLVEPAMMTIRADGHGEIAFGAMQASLDLENSRSMVFFTWAGFDESLHKILNKLQPSDKAQQFVDGVIWANCLELLDESEVCLVTGDKAFYRNYDYNHGLAPNLKAEAEKCPNKLYLFAGLDKLLQDARQAVHRVWPQDPGEEAPWDS